MRIYERIETIWLVIIPTILFTFTHIYSYQYAYTINDLFTLHTLDF